MSAEPGGLDDLAGTGTVIVDAGDLTVLPAFADSHEHLMEASRNTLLVPVDRARSVAEFTAMVAAAARDAAPGAWIVTSMGWHESNLAENRLPTGPSWTRPRRAIRCWPAAAGTWPSPAAPPWPRPASGPARPTRRAGRSAGCPMAARTGCWRAGRCTGLRRSPRPRGRTRRGAARGSAAYAALGVGTIREAMVNLDELRAYQDAAGRGRRVCGPADDPGR